MGDLWCPFAERYPGHPDKQGYTGAASPPGGPKTGVVYHSAEGWGATLRELVRSPSRAASWQFSVMRSGLLLQHYPVLANCWHCGDVSRNDNVDIEGMLAGNLDLVGWEFEGMAGDPLTEPQYQIALDGYKWVAEVCHFGPPSRTGTWPEKTMWEHREVSGTDCPTGRIPWDRLLRDVKEPAMTDAEAELEKHRKRMKVIKALSEGRDQDAVNAMVVCLGVRPKLKPKK